MSNILSASGEAVLFFPEAKRIIHMDEGTGDNLLDSDVADGIVSYVNLYCYRPRNASDTTSDAYIEVDGGEADFKKLVSELTDKEIIEAACYQMSIPFGSYMAEPCIEFDPETGQAIPANRKEAE